MIARYIFLILLGVALSTGAIASTTQSTSSKSNTTATAPQTTAQPTNTTSTTKTKPPMKLAYKSSAGVRKCKVWTKRCTNKRVCVYRKNRYSRRYQRTCWRCTKYLYPTSRYASMRRKTMVRKTCHKNVMLSVSHSGFKCVISSSSGRSCKIQEKCYWYCKKYY
jgi:homoserine trans-succinylase